MTAIAPPIWKMERRALSSLRPFEQNPRRIMEKPLADLTAWKHNPRFTLRYGKPMLKRMPILESRRCPLCATQFHPSKSLQVYCRAQCYFDSKKGKSPWNKGVRMWADRQHPRGTLGKTPANKGKRASIETRQKLSASHTGLKYPSHSGVNHWNWQNGKTPRIESLRQSAEYKAWRRSVYERDDYTCQACGVRSGNGARVDLHADHIMPVCLDESRIFDVSNGRTLCVPCHRKTDTYGSKILRTLRAIK